jgi:hypothetical protein
MQDGLDVRDHTNGPGDDDGPIFLPPADIGRASSITSQLVPEILQGLGIPEHQTLAPAPAARRTPEQQVLLATLAKRWDG